MKSLKEAFADDPEFIKDVVWIAKLFECSRMTLIGFDDD